MRKLSDHYDKMRMASIPLSVFKLKRVFPELFENNSGKITKKRKKRRLSPNHRRKIIRKKSFSTTPSKTTETPSQEEEKEEEEQQQREIYSESSFHPEESSLSSI